MGYGVQSLKMSSGTPDGLQKTVKTDYVLHRQVLESWGPFVDRVTANHGKSDSWIYPTQ